MDYKTKSALCSYPYLITEMFSKVDIVYETKIGNPVPRWVLLLPGAGCSWAKKSGGCYMCGFSLATQHYTRGKRLPWWIYMGLYLIGYAHARHHRPNVLTIFNGGSFINDEEIPVKAQLGICEAVSKDKTTEKLLIESRPEYVTEEKIAALSAILKDKRLCIGIGLECKDEFVRNHCIHKGCVRTDYERASEILKRYGVELLTYVFIKPLFLTEKEAMDEAIATAEYAFKIGSDEVAFQAAFVQIGTRLEKFYTVGKFRPPWLWTIIKVIQETYAMGPVTIGAFEDTPLPIAIPHNCERCSTLVCTLLDEFRRSHDLSLFDNLECECKERWEAEIASSSRSTLAARVSREHL